LIKATAIREAIAQFNRVSSHGTIEHILVHTGQAHDAGGVEQYFNDLELPKPDRFLDVGCPSPFEKTARIMERFAVMLLQERPAVVIVTGDGDSVLDCALVTKRIGSFGGGAGQRFVPALAHVEAGLRTFDRSAPQEVNTIVADLLSDYLFTTEESANRNLLQEGVPQSKIHFVGSVAIDTLLRQRPWRMDSSILNDLQLSDGSGTRPFALLTLQHLSDADDKVKLSQMLRAFSEIAQQMRVVFPARPAALKAIKVADMADYFVDHFLDGPESWDARVRIRLIPPLGYLDFVRLMSAAKVVLTDSSGVQEETRMLGVPCITMADHTSRRVTLEDGANVLAGTDPERIIGAFFKAVQGNLSLPEPPRGWDGRAAHRIVSILWNDFAPAETRDNPPTIMPKSVASSSGT
jgi:UDP-N-acetylglucosamine 2-epimerase (non-hydrolysing)